MGSESPTDFLMPDPDFGSDMSALVICLNVTIIGDDTVEDVEYINVTFTPVDNQTVIIGSSQAQVIIVDDDGEIASNISDPKHKFGSWVEFPWHGWDESSVLTYQPYRFQSKAPRS